MTLHRIPRAALAACALVALGSAQAQVTLSGRVDLNVGRDIGSSTTRMGSGAMSHIALSGSEDLGQGWQARFRLQTRINADDGTVNAPGAFLNSPNGTFWSQESSVSLAGPLGTLTLGRQMTAALLAQVLVDPWLWDNTTSMFTSTTGLVGNLWYNGALTWSHTLGGVSVSAQVAEEDGNPGWAGVTARNPYSLSVGYGSGPGSLRLGHERPADGTSKWTTLFGSWQFGVATVNALLGRGTDHEGAKVRTWAVSGTATLGTGQVRAAYGHYRRAGVTGSQKLSLGYYHPLSRRTSLYANLANDRKAAAHKTGYELGLQHVF